MIKKQLIEFQKLIDKEIDIFFKKRIIEVKNIDPKAVELMKILRDFVLNGGKRIRPALCYYGYRCFSDKDNKEVKKIAIALELIHCFLLIHDDIIDKDDIRRRSPTVHKVYEDIYRKRYKNAFDKRTQYEFGNAMAILAGDTLYSLANQLVGFSRFPDKTKNNIMIKLNQTVHKVIYGEILDVLLERKRTPTRKEIFKVLDLKTASYTVESPLIIGALCASAPKKEFKKLNIYSKNIGEAFQIKDDMLGIYGSQERLGKKIGNDVIEGKKTLLMTKALENLKGDDLRFLRSRLGSKDLTRTDFEKIKTLIKRSGSYDYCNNLIKELSEKAKITISGTGYKITGRSFLLELADYIVKRDK